MRTERTYLMVWPRCCVLGILSLLCVSSVIADHCPEGSVSPGKPETTLAGIDISHAHIEDVIRRFGPPASSTDGPCEGCPSGSGEGEHVWQIGGAQLTALTEFYRDDLGKKIESVLVMKVEGPSRVKRIRTGRGAGLGDSADKIKALYGPVYRTEPVNSPPLAGSMMSYCFSDETEVNFGIEHGYVTSLLVFISEE